MPLRIPDYHRKPIANLLGLNREQQKELVTALESVGVSLSADELTSTIVARLRLSVSEARGIVMVVLTFYSLREAHNLSTNDIVTQIIEAVEEQGVVEGLDPEKKSESEQFLREVLSFEETIGVTAKASEVLAEHPHPFAAARIVTDLRPVFVSTGSPRIASFLIVHNLKVRTHAESEANEFYFALDSADLRTLQKAIERAFKKEEELRMLTEKWGVPCLQPE